MEIKSLRLHVFDADIQALLNKAPLTEVVPPPELMPPAQAQTGSPVKGTVDSLTARIMPQQLIIAGKYNLAWRVSLPFTTYWELSSSGHTIVATLLNVDAIGVPVSVLKSIVLRAIADAVKQVPGVTVQGDSVSVCLADYFKSVGVDFVVHWTAVQLLAGSMYIDAAPLSTP